MRRFACVGGLVAVACIAATVRPGGLAFTAPAAAASPQPAITLSVTSGKPGTPVKITGSGFPPEEIVALYIDSPDPYIGNSPPGPRADLQGNFHDSFIWPDKKYDPNHRVDPTTAGAHQVCGDTGYPGNQQPIPVKACAQFDEIPLASPSPSPGAGGTGQGASGPELIAAFGIILAIVVGTVLWMRRPR